MLRVSSQCPRHNTACVRVLRQCQRRGVSFSQCRDRRFTWVIALTDVWRQTLALVVAWKPAPVFLVTALMHSAVATVALDVCLNETAERVRAAVWPPVPQHAFFVRH
ncbi:hypothetical protein BaRGS_00035628 [Batillaria attramentaria]|uniref:Uncharacterized protein n=1 Tax=Batillaria attramentaria TaxID=370345 RepID=A0ABD0JE78_9CAEN